MRFVVITGPSGAGKTLALHSFADAGYYAVDNLPPRLLSSLADFCRSEGRDRAVVVVDTRCGTAFAELATLLPELRQTGNTIEVLFLDASDETLVHRYKETRRPHPLLDGQHTDIDRAIAEERLQLETIRGIADHTLDTSSLTATQLRETVHTVYAHETRPTMLVTVISFGFKHGLPMDADLVFDVRFLSNPHYVPDLKDSTGLDPRVITYVHNDPRTEEFLRHMQELVGFALPQYQREGKAYLNIAIGCTGGRHRSVVLTEDLAEDLRQRGYCVSVRHRDTGERGNTVELSPETSL